MSEKVIPNDAKVMFFGAFLMLLVYLLDACN